MESSCEDSQDFDEEKIFVSIRLRPLNDRELSRNDVSQWEPLNTTTILFKNTLQEKTMLPTAYSFDRVFGCESPTRQVYDEAAKKIALSVLNGMNSTIFAYGQTSSGKTYTMSGVTEYTIADIFDYIDTHSERAFILRFSAMEIYNEAVRDLLVLDGPPLRLLDDPDRGTFVDKLTEVTIEDNNHLTELVSICEEQRQIGETTLNEVSSRSHQILRLTVESEACGSHVTGSSSLLTASVSFVDLAGSERASQTLSAGSRLKEGCHINRSLLTLGTVIRKLSKGRNAHIPYRDSKLTRILQNSLGGNARTAIICTMSPAHTHLEQSRNTLLFASCAKQVSTNAQVNVVMSEKALVKSLQKELARLEAELKKVAALSSSHDSSTALREKELLIQKMDTEIKELTHQRDSTQAHIEEMIRSASEKSSLSSEYTPSEASDDTFRSGIALRASHLSERYFRLLSSSLKYQFPDNNEDQFLSDDTSPGLDIDKYFGPDPCLGWEKMTQEESDHVLSSYSPEKQNTILDPPSSQVNLCSPDNDVYFFTRRDTVSCPPSPPKEDHVADQSPCSSDNCSSTDMPRSKSCEAILTTLTKSPSSQLLKGIENTSQGEDDDQEKTLSNLECREDSNSSERRDDKDEDQIITTSDTDCMDKQRELINEAITRKSLRQLSNDVVRVSPSFSLQETVEEKTPNKPEETTKETTSNGSDNTRSNIQASVSDWHAEFEKQMQKIIELWDACHVPLVHRSYFFLLFRGDPSDAVYLEVELRRLSFLKKTIHGARVMKDDQFSAKASSAKALNRDRRRLSQQMFKKYSTKEREALYRKWGINVKSKQRRLQLCRRIWTNTTDTKHINESALIVAKLVGFKELGQTHKEMFGLSFLPASKRSLFKLGSII